MKDRLFALIAYVGAFVFVMWAVLIIEVQVGQKFYEWGILPRSVIGLRGIICSPFLHGNLEHLVANTIPFMVLGSLVAMHGSAVFWRATTTIVILGGFLVWLIGSQTFHIGASGLVFGYLGYLLTYGWYVKRFLPIIVSLVVFVLYGGALLGVLPSDPHISWYSHLFGFIAGIQAARDQAVDAKRSSHDA